MNPGGGLQAAARLISFSLVSKVSKILYLKHYYNLSITCLRDRVSN